jgi:uracil-DNA glycosylase
MTPLEDAATQAEVRWALSYDGYRRLASTPEKLEKVLRSARNSFASRRAVPDWCGVDFLRGWAFYLVRADRHAGGGTLSTEWGAVLDALNVHPHAHVGDRPPKAGFRSSAVDTGLGLPTKFSTEPKLHRDRDFLEAKQARLWEPHVAPINALVDEIRAETKAFVPYVDPDSGGALARVLFVLESPARPAALGSGMLSADNDDETAKNIWEAYRETGMPRTHGLPWNAVPWFVGNEERNAAVKALDVERGRRYLIQLLDRALDIGVVLAMGKPAQKSVSGAATELAARGIRVIETPHPSPRNYNSPTRSAKQRIHAAFADAMASLEDRQGRG